MALTVLLPGCSFLPRSGPMRQEVEASAKPSGGPIQIVEVDDAVARQLLSNRAQRKFSEAFPSPAPNSQLVGSGDVLEVSIWEAPPAALFGGSIALVGAKGAPSTSSVTTLPEQIVSREGTINVPFAGSIKASGRSLQQVESEIINRLKGKANQPQVLVRLIRNDSANVTVVGDVAKSLRMPITPVGERLLDALAAAGGVRQPVSKTTIEITRGKSVHAMPLESIIRDPRQNITLQSGDVITASFQPLSFTSLGATGKNEEINFETQGISLAQALARSGGLLDNRSDARGVFIFRMEAKDALRWPAEKVATTPDGKVPVVYRIDMKDPNSFFVAQSFPIQDKDLLYVSNSTSAELQKFLNIVLSFAYVINLRDAVGL